MIITLGTTPTIQRSMTFRSLVLDEVNRAITVREYASGKSINAARVLHSIGERVGALSVVGGDRGVQMRRDLATANIPHTFVDCAAQTRLCITLIDQSNHTATEIVEEAIAIERAAVDELWKLFDRSINSARGLVLSGTLAPGVGDDFYARCVRRANGIDIFSVLDARGEPLKLALAERPMVVKPNRAELSATVGFAIDSSSALHEAMQQVISMGATWIVVTGGGTSPTTVSNGMTSWQIDVPKVQVISPIGSGDSFAAGLAAGIRRGQSVPEACKLAAACAAANAMTADAGHVRREDVDALIKLIEVVETP